MGNEVSTVGGAVATVATSVAAGVTLGQVDALNKAVLDCAKFTAKHAEETTVRHVGEAAACAVATAGVGAAALVTFGEVDEVNQTLEHYAKSTADSAAKAGKGLVQLVDEVSDGLPIIAHFKGGFLYAVGEEERADRAIKSGTRTLGTMAGGALGFVGGGPVGAVAGGVAAGAAMDGIITGVDSAVHKEFRPSGQVAAWHAVAKGESSDDIIAGVIGGTIIPVLDGAVGSLSTGKAYGRWGLSKKLLTHRKFNMPDGGGEDELSVKTVHGAEANADQELEPDNIREATITAGLPISSEGIADNDVYKDMAEGQGADCKFVSTSMKFGVVRRQLDKAGSAESEFALLKLKPKRGIDLQITAENMEGLINYPYPGESDVCIGPQNIMGVLVGKKGAGFTWHRNSNYDPPPRPANVDIVAYLSYLPVLW